MLNCEYQGFDQVPFRLAKSFNADVVITMSALRTLVNNTAPFSEEWEMPMTIKQVKGNWFLFHGLALLNMHFKIFLIYCSNLSVSNLSNLNFYCLKS